MACLWKFVSLLVKEIIIHSLLELQLKEQQVHIWNVQAYSVYASY